MGVMDDVMVKMKQVAGDVGEAAKKGAAQLQTKVEQAQLRRRADEAAKELGYLVYRSPAQPPSDEVERLKVRIRQAENDLAQAGAAAGAGPGDVPPPAPEQAVEEAAGE